MIHTELSSNQFCKILNLLDIFENDVLHYELDDSLQLHMTREACNAQVDIQLDPNFFEVFPESSDSVKTALKITGLFKSNNRRVIDNIVPDEQLVEIDIDTEDRSLIFNSEKLGYETSLGDRNRAPPQIETSNSHKAIYRIPRQQLCQILREVSEIGDDVVFEINPLDDVFLIRSPSDTVIDAHITRRSLRTDPIDISAKYKIDFLWNFLTSLHDDSIPRVEFWENGGVRIIHQFANDTAAVSFTQVPLDIQCKFRTSNTSSSGIFQ